MSGSWTLIREGTDARVEPSDHDPSGRLGTRLSANDDLAAFAEGRGTIECAVLPRTYDHLLPLVKRQRPQHELHPTDAENGGRRSDELNCPADSVVDD